MRRIFLTLALSLFLVSSFIPRVVSAAATTHEIGTADIGNTPNATGAFTPAVGDLLIAFCVGSDTVADAADAVTGSAGPAFIRFATVAYNTTSYVVQGYVATTLVTSATSQTVTWTPNDTASGSVIYVCAIAGMTRAGLQAIRQSASQANQGASVPAPAFSVAALTGNPTLGCIGNVTNPATMTPPTSWTEGLVPDLGHGTPTTGAEYVFRDSGFTGTTVTWGSSSASAFGSLIVELDTSAPPTGRRRAVHGD